MISPGAALWIFLGWMLLQMSLLLIYHSRGRMLPTLRLMMARVDAEEFTPAMEKFIPRVLWVFVAAFLTINILAVFLYLQAIHGSLLASIVFAVIAAWSFYDAIAKPLVFNRLYPGQMVHSDWALVALDASMWPLLSASLAVHWMNVG